MTELDDHELLTAYARTASEAAFAELVSRYVNLVHSAARRFTGNPHHAEEITQAVFIILARKASSLGRSTILSGWLYQTTRLTAANFVKGEIRRQHREQEVYMQSQLNDDAAWYQIAPALDEAMGSLGEADRNAVVLRFFENKTALEVATVLKINEAAAHKRVARALEKLRKFFVKRGVALSLTAIAGAVSANSVQAAPAGLAPIISAVAAAKGATAGGSTLTLVKGALKIMAWSKAKIAVVTGVCVVLALGTTVGVERMTHPPRLSATDLSWADDARYWALNSMVLDKVPPVYILRPTHFPHGGGSVGMMGASGIEKITHLNEDVGELLDTAFDYDHARSIFPDDLPPEHYDLMFTLPEDYHQKLKDEIRSKFGLTAHVETRTVDVWVLQVKVPGAPGLKPATAGKNQWIGAPFEAKIYGTRVAYWTGWLEEEFGRPVINSTGLHGTYDVDLKWKPGPGQSNTDALRQALLDQLGLELVPDRQPIQMLVVEKVPS